MGHLSQNTDLSISILESASLFQNPRSRDEQAKRDLELVAAARAGSPSAFDELQKRYSRRLSSTVLRITKNREDAEDALQDTFLRAFMALPQFECRSTVYSWLTRIAINSALMILRKRRTRRESNPVHCLEGHDSSYQLDVEDTTPNPEQVCELRQQCNYLMYAIQRLRPQLRRPIEIQLIEECSMKEIARKLRISLPAAKARLHRARAQLVRRTPARTSMWNTSVQ